MALKERLKDLRNEKGISAAKLAEVLGKATSTVAMWEIGKANPDIETLLTLADYFECSVDYLLGKSSIKSPNIDIQRVVNFSGLSEKAVKTLNSMRYNTLPSSRELLLNLINYLIEQEEPAPYPYDFLCPIFDEFEHPTGEYEEESKTNYEIAYTDWENAGFIPVLTAFANFLYVNPKSNLQYGINTRGELVREDEIQNELRLLKENDPLGFLLGTDEIIDGLSGSEIIENVLFLSLQNAIKDLRTKYKNTKIMQIGDDYGLH